MIKINNQELKFDKDGNIIGRDLNNEKFEQQIQKQVEKD